MRIKVRALLATLLALSGCAALGEFKEKPRVSIAGIQVTDANLFEQRYRLQLRVQNPNPVDLRIGGLDYVVEINGKPFATGVSSRAVVVPKYGATLLDVEGTSTLGALIKQLKDLDILREQSAKYVIKGTLRVSDRDLNLPFVHRGDVPFGFKPSFF